MTYKKFIPALLLILAFLTACGAPVDNSQIAGLQTTAASATEVTDRDELVYTAIYGTAPSWLGALTTAVAGNGRFWQQQGSYENGVSSLYIASFAADGGYFARHPYEVAEGRSLTALAPIPGEMDGLWFLESDSYYDGGTQVFTSHEIVRCDAEGKAVVRADVSNLDVTSITIGLSAGVSDAQGNYYLCVDGTFYAYDDAGKELFRLETVPSYNEPELALTADGLVAVLCETMEGSTLQLIDPTVQDYTYTRELGKMHMASGDEFYDLYLFDKVLYGLNLTDDSMTRILRFADLDVNESDIVRITSLGASDTGAPMFGCYDRSYGDLSPVLLKQVKAGLKKTVLTLAVTTMNQTLQEQIIQFNRRSLDYRIDYTEYATHEDPTGLTGLTLALTTGDLPDFLVLDGTPYKSYIEKGLLLDLAPYMAADNKVTQENIHPTTLRALETDGAIYGLTPICRLNATLVLKKAVGNVDTWDFATVNAILDAHPGMNPTPKGTREYTWQQYLDGAAAACIDEDAGSCSFENEEFYAFLDFCTRFPEQSPYGDDVSTNDLFDEGVGLMNYRWIMHLRGFLEYRARYGDDLLVPGMPGVGNTLEFYDQVAITTACEHPDAAWEFLRQYASCIDGADSPFDIPILLDEYKEHVAEVRRYVTEHDMGYISTDADFAAWEEVMNSAVRSPEVDSALLDIVREEVQVHLERGRSAEETARVIESRVKIALSEMG